MEQQFSMQSISLANQLDQMKLDLEENAEKARVEGSRDVQATKDALAERRAIRERELADFKEQTKAEVSKINAESKEMTVKLRFEKEQVMQNFKLEAEEASNQVRARVWPPGPRVHMPSHNSRRADEPDDFRDRGIGAGAASRDAPQDRDRRGYRTDDPRRGRGTFERALAQGAPDRIDRQAARGIRSAREQR